jgi:hypothetical protein
MSMTPIDEGQTVERLVRVETKLDILIADLGPRHSDMEGRLRKTESTLANVQQRVGMISTGIGGLAGIASALIVHFLGA